MRPCACERVRLCTHEHVEAVSMCEAIFTMLVGAALDLLVCEFERLSVGVTDKVA